MKIRSILTATAAASATVAVLAPVAPAAAEEDPMPAFSFADCPAAPAGSVLTNSFCFNVVVTSGVIKAGGAEATITKPMKMTYGTFTDAANNKSLVFGKLRAEEEKLKDGIFHDPITEVWGKPAYVGNFSVGRNFKTTIDLKMQLTRPFILQGCEIGTTANPIKLNLITGTTAPPPPNTPISGKPIQYVQQTPIVVGKLTLVDNSFSAPGAKGCVLNLGLVNHIVNSQAGLPSAAGKNTAILNSWVGQKTYDKL